MAGWRKGVWESIRNGSVLNNAPDGDVRYPRGYERKGPDGKDLYMVMRKNCYGHPAASKAWSEHRNEFVMKEFNKPGWEIHRCTYDPCLFYIKKDPKMGWTQDTIDSNCPNSTSTRSEIGGSKAEVKFLKDGSLESRSVLEHLLSIHVSPALAKHCLDGLATLPLK